MCKELADYSIDIAALSEMRLSDTGERREKSYTFFWSGHPHGSSLQGTSGAGFAIANHLLAKLTELPRSVSDRIMTLRLPTSASSHATIVSVYAPTLVSEQTVIDSFYTQLRNTLSNISHADSIIVLGDFNARVGSDSTTWPNVLEKFGRGSYNSNGELLHQVCNEYELAVTNTFFNVPDHHFYSWKHPRSGHWHLLDYILISQSQLKNVCVTRAMRGAECSTDHYMIRCRLMILPYHPRRKTAPKPIKRPDIRKLKEESIRLKLSSDFLSNFTPLTEASAEEKWEHFKTCVYTQATQVLGFPKRKNADWFDECDEAIADLAQQKKKAFHAYL